MESLYSLKHHCYDVCHCDWRINLYGCMESNAVRIINIMNISISILASFIGIGLVFHRIVIKGHVFMDPVPKRGLLRPKPIDCMILFLTIFNLLRLISSAILVADAAPENLIFRSFLFEIGWQFGYASFALYLIGISQALAESHKSISSSWLPSPHVVDIIGSIFLLAPFIVNNPLSLAAGAMATSNIKIADTCTQVLYIFWFIHCSSLATAVIYCGSRLVQTLENHLKKFTTSGKRSNKVKAGIFKIRAMMFLISICLFMFACFLALYGILRNLILKNNLGSIILCTIWNMLGPVMTLLVEFAIIFTPKVSKESSVIRLKSSSGERSSTLFETQSAVKVNGDITFQDTLTNGALDDLRLQHEDVMQNQFGKSDFKSNLKNESPYFYVKKSGGLHMDELDPDYEYVKLKRYDSRTQLIDKRY